MSLNFAWVSAVMWRKSLTPPTASRPWQPEQVSANSCAPARLLVFKLGGTQQLPPLPEREPLANPPPVRATEAQIAAGAQLFAETCAVCHGQNAVGGVKDLRHMTPDTHAKFNAIVLEGLYLEKGMASFADILTPEQVEQIHHYLIARANEDWGER